MLIDGFQRRITYLRLSVTDRCDLRCAYCMPRDMAFLPRRDLLTLDELHRLARAFIDRGVRTIRITGGEPLVRRDVMDLVRALGRDVGAGLDDTAACRVFAGTAGAQSGNERTGDALHRCGYGRCDRDQLRDVAGGEEEAGWGGVSGRRVVRQTLPPPWSRSNVVMPLDRVRRRIQAVVQVTHLVSEVRRRARSMSLQSSRYIGAKALVAHLLLG